VGELKRAIRDFPAGWYASRAVRDPLFPNDCVVEYFGPFAGGEDECQQWIEQREADTPHIVEEKK
jgi:hypothetical protein